MKRIFFTIAGLLAVVSAFSVELKSEGRDAQYVESIVGRSQKIVDKLGISDPAVAADVLNIIANRYFELNDIYAEYDAAVAAVKESVADAELKNRIVDGAKKMADSNLYRTHFAFPAALSIYLTDSQIEVVKDGMTFGVVGVTYTAYCDMIPTLTDEEKSQSMAWLREARELAMDASNSENKHKVFGNYKGRINNYLSSRGYDLTSERAAWQQRIEQRQGAHACAGK